ncbi:hypothetical protein [Terrimonas sp.]|uniref:hypothetical protein n=1 Tax=Terrimonas sp. TaxID=1914338 RepID=UPI0014026CD9|nr:hypothetical protein [Terrimonas sp.]
MVTNIMSDMWYLDADWTPYQSDTTLKFEKLASGLKSNDVIKEPSNGIIALLKYDDVPSKSHSILILSIDHSKIFMRMVSDEVAAYADKKLLKPWQSIENPSFYETELKKEVSFFHPLNWKKVRAIANRTDRDDVVFEVLNGRSKYAIVHLTWRKENSRKFPITKFYIDWQDIYKNRLLEDHNDWDSNM